MTQPSAPETSTPQSHPAEWLTDSNGQLALSIRYKDKPLFQEQSPYQTVEVFDTYSCGKMLTIDSMVMCTEWDEAAYHEMIAQVPMLTHPGIKDVLVIGAGDGGTIREVLRHEGVQKITMVEIDEAVIRASQQFLPGIASAFSDPRLDLRVDDGIKFVGNAPADSYDLIVIDSSDPVGPSEGLFTKSFYEGVFRALRPGGVITVQSESPSFNPKAFTELNVCLKEVFGQPNVHCYLVHIPTYPTGMWSLTYCSKQGPHPVQNFDRAKAEKFTATHGLRYYNADIHQAAFCLPTYVRNMIHG